MQKFLLAVTVSAFACGSASAQFENKENFPDRRAVIINNAPTTLELSGFSFSNEFRDRTTREVTNLKWKNVGQKAISAFEVVIRYYDPFNRPMLEGGRWMITGHDSGNWSPLNAGESSEDGLIGLSSTEALTAIVYVRAIRYSDGTVWTSNQPEVEQRVKAELPQLKDVGTLDPGPKNAGRPQ